MDGQDNDGPDSSSIKPVSSLRSRFENKPTATPPSQERARGNVGDKGPSGGQAGRNTLDKPNPTIPPARRSIDATSRPFVTPRDAGQEVRVGSQRSAIDTQSSRPQSMLVQSPPRVDVTAPASPPKKIQIPQSDVSTTAPSQLSTPKSSKGLPPPLPAPRHARFASKSQAPHVQELSDETIDPTAPSKAPGADKPVSDQPKPAKQPPPPVNRAAKPGLLKLEPRSTPDLAVVSPFDASTENPLDRLSSPPAIDLSTKPRPQSTVAPAASSTAHTKDPSNSLHAPALITHTSTTPRYTSLHGRRRSRSAIEDSTDDTQNRPSLPPRPTGTEPMIRNHAKLSSSENDGRRSMEIPSRPSALSQGFSRDDSSSLVRASHAPYGNQSVPSTPIRSARSTPPPRPVSGIPRSFKTESRSTAEAEPASAAYEAATESADFPDSSNANRRAPVMRDGPKMIATGYEPRLFDISGEFVCTAGMQTRVWNLLTGKLILSMTHGEQVRISAMCFKPSRSIEGEGKMIWVGTNWGELQEIDVTSKRITGLNDTAHSRREIVKILRRGIDMWTLDREGKVMVWPVGQDGSPSLSSGVYNGRIPQGHTTSVVAGQELWVATGRAVHVFRPTSEAAQRSFKVTEEALTVPNASDMTSSAVVSSQPDRVYFGHADGKVSVFSKQQRRLIETNRVSSHKINCLAGVGKLLWAGFNTGAMVALDTTTRPWTTKKHWTQHKEPVTGIISDASSLWKLGRWHVVSLAIDNVLAVWDGMLEEDWIEDYMRIEEANYCAFREVSAAVLTWNAGACTPTDLRYDEKDSNFFREFLRGKEAPDIMVFGLQELVDLEDKKLTAKSFFKSRNKDPYGNEQLSSVYRTWRDYLARCIDEYAAESGGYVQLQTSSMVGLFTCIFVKGSLRPRIRDVQAAEVKTGMGGLHGNKGALIVRFLLEDSSVCFTNCHLAAGQTSTAQRNNDIRAILGAEQLPVGRRGDYTSYACGGDGSMVVDHEICILNGDLNYRIDTMSRDAVVSAVRNQNLAKLLERDQLLLSRRKNPDFRLRDFREQAITFQPTYKYDVNTDNYDTSEKRRAPAWCDRILHRGDGVVEQSDYRRHEMRSSDHRPVTASFKLSVKAVDHAKREACRRESAEEFDEHKERVSTEAKLDYLVHVFGLSKDEAKRRLLQD